MLHNFWDTRMISENNREADLNSGQAETQESALQYKDGISILETISHLHKPINALHFICLQKLLSIKMRMLSVLTPLGTTELSVKLRTDGWLADNYNSSLKHELCCCFSFQFLNDFVTGHSNIYTLQCTCLAGTQPKLSVFCSFNTTVERNCGTN